MPNIIKNLNFFKNGFKKKSALGGFGLEGFWIAHTIYLMDFGVPKMGSLVFLLGVIERGVWVKTLPGSISPFTAYDTRPFVCSRFDNLKDFSASDLGFMKTF